MTITDTTSHAGHDPLALHGHPDRLGQRPYSGSPFGSFRLLLHVQSASMS